MEVNRKRYDWDFLSKCLNGKQPLYRNDSRLSTEGSLLIVPAFEKVFSGTASETAARAKRPG